MKKLVGLRRRLTYANVVATLALFFALCGGVAAAVPDANGLIHGCRSKSTGDLRVIDPQASQSWLRSCSTAAETPVDWTASPDTAQQVLDKVKTVDGAGSGLDADTLDGINSTGFLGINAKAADSDLLDGLNSSAFLGVNAKAADSDKLDGIDSTGFLGVNARAADSDQLDGMDSTQFIQGGGHSVTEFVRVPPGGSRAFDLPGFGTIQFDCRLNDAESRPQVRISFFTSGLRTLAAASVADIDARRPGGGSLGLPDTQVGFSANPLDLDDAWIAAATITGGSPTVSAFGIAYGQIGECAIQFHAAIG
jgi:hypothetical protein